MRKLTYILIVFLLPITILAQTCFNNNYSLSFTGTNGFIRIGNNSSLNIGVGLTVEMWVKPVSFGANGSYLLMRGGGSCEPNGRYALRLTNNGFVEFTYSESPSYAVVLRANQAIPLNSWSHISLTYNYQSLNGSFAINGEFVGQQWISPPQTSTLNFTSISDIVVGARPAISSICNTSPANAHSDFFNGQIDDLRLFNTNVTAEIRTAFYNKSISVIHPNYANCLLEYRFDQVNTPINSITGSPLNAFLIGSGVNLLTSDAAPVNIYNRSCHGYAVNGEATAGDIATLDGVNALTIGAWVYPTSTPSAINQVRTIIAKSNNHGAAGSTFALYLIGTAGSYNLVASLGNGTTVAQAFTNGTIAIPPNKWTYITMSWTSGNILKLYSNNNLVATSAGTLSGTPVNTTVPLSIGWSSSGNEWGFTGYIDEVSIFSAELAPSTIAGMLNAPITSSHPNYLSLRNYWRFDGDDQFAPDFGCGKNTISFDTYFTRVNSFKPFDGPGTLVPPVNFSASSGLLDRVTLTWENDCFFVGGFNAEPQLDGTLGYDIFRDGTYLTTLVSSGATNTYSDTGATCIHTYSIVAFWRRASDNTIIAIANPVTTVGRIRNINFNASNGNFVNKTVLTWDNISSIATAGFEVKRNGQQIAILSSPNSTQYTDFDGTPGVRYIYELKPLASGQNYRVCPDTGWIKENGRLSGYVRTPLNAPVPGVIVTATGTVLGQTYTYTDTTDASGFYEIRDVYYDLQATYTLTPSKGTHQFNPASLQRTLDVLAFNAPQANFTDTSVFTVSGKIYYPNQLGDPGCGHGDVVVLVNGQDVGVKTANNGTFSYVVQNEGNVTFTPVYRNHTFNPSSVTKYISDNDTVSFQNNTTDSLYLDVKGYCHTQIVTNAQIKVAGLSESGCYEQVFNVPGNDGLGVELPAQEYLVQLLSVNSGNPNTDIKIMQNVNTLLNVDLRNRDTILQQTVVGLAEPFVDIDTLFLANGQIVIEYDTINQFDTITEVITPAREAKYIYGGELAIDLLGIDPLCSNKIVLAQGNTYQMRINVFREYDFPTGTITRCPLDTGQVTIFDEISDSNFVYRTLDTFFVRYNINPGKPNISGSGAHPYQKFISVFAETWDAPDTDTSFWAIVEGNRALTPTFITKTPELPFFVLHDPPGDGSSATISEGTSLSFGYEMGVEEQVGTNSFVNVSVGAEIPVPFTGIVFNAGASLNLSVATNNVNTSNRSVNTTFTTLNTYSTSDNENFIGEDADVVVGASLNLIYGLSYIVSIDTSVCAADLDTALTWGANDFATTYAYTIGHVKNTLIPQFEFLRDFYTSQGSDSALIYQNYINVWQQVVDQNHQNIANAEFKENRSFSGGVAFSNTSTYENTNGFSVSYQTSINPVIAAAINVGTEQNNVEAGTEVNMSWTTTTNKSNEVTQSKEITYTLNDKDPGDFFSVDIKRDKVYGTPAFKVVAGTSSCPHEQGTQQRDLPQISVLNPNVQNVPIDQQATFTIQMTNLSESQETRTYEVIIDPSSNLEGAVIRLAGQVITQAPATFTIPANGSVFATMSVEPGPIAVDYTNLRLIMYSACDEDIEDDAVFNVGFQSNCSDVTLFTPSNNWLINNQSNILTVTYGGFNANDTSLQQIGLQVRRPGQTWSTVPQSLVSKAQLQQNNFPYYAVDLNMGGLADGPYEIRAFADCNTQPPVRSFSAVLEGVIDRTSVTLFGTPSPTDGVLNLNEEVSVTFSENVDCPGFFNAQSLVLRTVTLVEANGGNPVPFTYTCSGNKIIFTIAPSALPSLQGKLLTATVGGYYDVNGNILQQPIVWSFVVNNSEVFWQPSGVSVSVVSGGNTSFAGTLRNLSTSSKAFTLTQVPGWLTPINPPASIAQGAALNINFNVSGILNPGVYRDTLFADIAGVGLQPLYIELTVYANSPVWTPVTKPAQMNIIANFSLTSANAPLSMDVNDKIAVFVGNECRGVANIQYTPAGNSYAAYITAYGNTNASPVEVFEFRMWDASEGKEYQAIETQAFVENAQVGQPLAPKILHPAGLVQRIPLSTGWNWVSTYLNPNNPNVGEVMKYVAGTSGNIIKTNDSYAQYSNLSGGWQGTLTTIGWQKSYQIFVNSPTVWQVIGKPLPDTTLLPLVAGWNWIGYPQSVVDSLQNFMQSYAAVSNDVFQSNNQFSTFAGGIWNGSLQLLQPGRGYKLKSNNGGNIEIVPRAVPNWNPDIFGSEFNMTVTAVVKANGVESIGNFIVGAFINGTCVGVSSPQMAGSNPRVFLTLHGNPANNNQPVEFLIYDYVTDSVYTPVYSPLVFTTDAQEGTIENAFELVLANPLSVKAINKGKFILHQNIPNPFNGQTTIAFELPRAEHVTLDVFDYTGKRIQQLIDAELSEGKHTVQFNQEGFALGVYFYRMVAGDFTATKKMVIE